MGWPRPYTLGSLVLYSFSFYGVVAEPSVRPCEAYRACRALLI